MAVRVMLTVRMRVRVRARARIRFWRRVVGTAVANQVAESTAGAFVNMG